MLKHHASEGPAELQWGSTLIQETPGVRQSYSCVALRRHRLSVIVDSDGKVRVAFVQEDHMSRLDPDEIVSILKDWGAR